MYVNAEISIDGSLLDVIIAVGEGSVGKYDDKIFFYVDSEEELYPLMNDDNGEDFVVRSIKERYDNIEDIFE